jgi:cytochrome c biogenesis protein CcdA
MEQPDRFSHVRFLAMLVAAVLGIGFPLSAWSGGIALSAAEWSFGSIGRGAPAEFELTVTNNENRTVAVSIIPTSDFIRSDPGRLAIQPGKAAVFRLTYDSSDDSGEVRKDFVISTDSDSLRTALFPVHGTVGTAQSGPAVLLGYYYTPGCRTCELFLSQEIPRLERDLGIRLTVEKHDVLDPAGYSELEKLVSSLGAELTAFPVLRMENTLLQGEPEIREKLSGILQARAAERAGSAEARDAAEARGAADETGGTPSAEKPSEGALTALESLSALPVIAGGLLDGINPCAFTTLIFLLASLALAGRGRREVLIIGALFSFAVFLTYLSIGLGFFAALRAASAYSLVSRILRWVLFAVLAAFAGLSVYDYAVIRGGRPTEILLQLPLSLKKRIHSSIRTRVRTAALAGSSLVLGFLVSVFEFACTGQVYLPTLAYLVRMGREPRALLLLLLYNLAFIAPLLIVFGASYMGVGSERITKFFQKHMAAVKLGLAAFFLGLAAVTLAG